MELFIFIIGTVIFCTYMFFLVRMINTSHKKQAEEEALINAIENSAKKKKKKYSRKKAESIS